MSSVSFFSGCAPGANIEPFRSHCVLSCSHYVFSGALPLRRFSAGALGAGAAGAGVTGRSDYLAPRLADMRPESVRARGLGPCDRFLTPCLLSGQIQCAFVLSRCASFCSWVRTRAHQRRGPGALRVRRPPTASRLRRANMGEGPATVRVTRKPGTTPPSPPPPCWGPALPWVPRRRVRTRRHGSRPQDEPGEQLDVHATDHHPDQAPGRDLRREHLVRPLLRHLSARRQPARPPFTPVAAPRR